MRAYPGVCRAAFGVILMERTQVVVEPRWIKKLLSLLVSVPQ